MTWHLTTAQRESAFAKEKELKSWGLTIRDFTSCLHLKQGVPIKMEFKFIRLPGAVHPTVQNHPYLPGDVITSIDGKKVLDLKDMMDISYKITRGKSETVATLVSFERDMANYSRL